MTTTLDLSAVVLFGMPAVSSPSPRDTTLLMPRL